ncbi:MAG: CarD family transcriptional regulator [Peptostreptococcaceae bacterium]|nr:CarD family transcriptional regulator [Peptostreptococcaceae bacterium]
MFAIGDNISYPMHGAGTIQKIENREILGELREYYCLLLPYSKMNVMIPVDNSDKIGVRPIIDKMEIDKVFEVLKEESSTMSDNWNRRYRENNEKLKTGDIFIVAGVVRDLVRNDRIKKLSTGEKKLLNNAKQILESEVILAGGHSMEETEKRLEEAI